MNVKCCKCFSNTRKFECPKCGHRICTSCKEVKRKPRAKRKSQARGVDINGIQLHHDLYDAIRLHDIL